jgi:hypothetical protein
MGMYRESPAVCPLVILGETKGERREADTDTQLQAMTMPGILVTTIKNKERAAEKDMIELLERVCPLLISKRGE